MFSYRFAGEILRRDATDDEAICVLKFDGEKRWKGSMGYVH